MFVTIKTLSLTQLHKTERLIEIYQDNKVKPSIKFLYDVWFGQPWLPFLRVESEQKLLSLCQLFGFPP